MGIIDKVATAIVKDAAATAAIGALDAADKGVKAIGEKIDNIWRQSHQALQKRTEIPVKESGQHISDHPKNKRQKRYLQYL